MRPPVCAVCERMLDEPAAGLVRFQPTDESRAWRERAERDGFVGHPPDEGWFCATHVDRARELATTHALADALRRVAFDARRAANRAQSVDTQRTDAPVIRTRPIAPRGIDELGRAFRELVPALAELVGVPAPRLERVSTRTWHPMDGSVAPDCPFADDIRWTEPDAPISLSGDRAWWNPDTLARASETLSVRVPRSDIDVSITGAIPADGSSRMVTELMVLRRLPDEIAAVLDAALPPPAP